MVFSEVVPLGSKGVLALSEVALLGSEVVLSEVVLLASKVVLVSSTASIDEPPALPTLCIKVIPRVQRLAGTNHLLLETAGGSVSARRGRRLEYRNLYYDVQFCGLGVWVCRTYQ